MGAPGRGGRLLVAVKRYLSGFEAVGVDEVIWFPTSVDPDQVDLLAGAVR